MTKLAVLADVHGNLPALEAVMADLVGREVDQVVVAGDVINWGPFSREVLEVVGREGWATIRGNNELYLLDYGTPRADPAWSDPRQYPLLPWLQRQLAEPWRRAIAIWPDALSLRLPDAPTVRVVHGTPASPWRGLLPDSPDEVVAAALAGVEESTVVAGHTHLPMVRQVARWRVVNPGSVGVPLRGRHVASYALMAGSPDGWTVQLREVPFDPGTLLVELERRGFEAECGPIGRLVLDELRTARLRVVPFLVWRDRRRPGEPVDWRLLEEFLAAEVDDYTPPPYRLPLNGRRATVGLAGPATARDPGES